MNSLATARPYTTDFDAQITDKDGRELVLDRTYFYPESGGQPADRGVISENPVVDVQQRDGDVIHTLSEPIDTDLGETVSCAIDPAFRTHCMRTHTASHVLYGAGRRLLSDLGYGGFDIDERKARIDFETSTEIDDGVLVDLERLANRAVWEHRPVSWETIPADEARTREEVAFNTKTEEGIFNDGEDEGVRIVTVATGSANDSDWDAAACGGTHVKNTGEIGFVSVLGRSNPGEGLTRVELAVGPEAIDGHAETRMAALTAARTLGVGVSDLPDAVERQRTEIAQLEAERDDLSNRIIDAQLAVLGEPVEYNGERWLVGTFSGVDSDTLSKRARELVGERGDVIALVTESDPTTVIIASVGETDAGGVINDLTTEFGGGGGGGPDFAQGGGIAADPADVVSFLRSA